MRNVSIFIVVIALILGAGSVWAGGSASPYAGKWTGVCDIEASAANYETVAAWLEVGETGEGKLWAELGHDSTTRYAMTHYRDQKRGKRGGARLSTENGREVLVIGPFKFYLDGDRLVGEGLMRERTLKWSFKRLPKPK